MSECLPDLPRYIRQHDNEWQGADHQGGPWRPIPAPQQALPWPIDGPAVQSREPASVAPEARPMSPAAQAVLDAYGDFEPANVDAMAAALRAVAGQICPHSPCQRRVLAIAAELEETDG